MTTAQLTAYTVFTAVWSTSLFSSDAVINIFCVILIISLDIYTKDIRNSFFVVTTGTLYEQGIREGQQDTHAEEKT